MAETRITPIEINNPYKARAYRSSYIDQGDATWTKVSLNAESYDTNNNFDITTNYRYDVPVDGYYLVNGSVYMTGVGLSAVQCYLAKSGTVFCYGSYCYGADGAVGISKATDIVYLTAGQYIELYSYGNCTPGGIRVQGGESLTYLSICLISKT